MYVYHLVNGLTGRRRELLNPTAAPSWARRPEPVAWSVSFNVRPQPQRDRAGITEGNPMAGLQHRITPWRDVITVSWQAPDGMETALAAGIISSPLKVSESAGTLTVDTKCFRTLMEDRLLLVKTLFPPTRYKVSFTGLSWQGIVSEIVRYATRNYAAIPADGILPGAGFELPVDLPAVTSGNQSMEWWGYSFKTAGEALDDVETEAGMVVDFRPYWTADRRLRWATDVFTDGGRSSSIVDMGSTSGRNPQAVYEGTTVDASGAFTAVHQTGKGSEVDILYTRRIDSSPTVMARETLIARSDFETERQLDSQAQETYAQTRRTSIQDAVSMRVSDSQDRWVPPTRLRLGSTVQLTVNDSLQYGDATLRRTLIGWQASGDAAISLELQDLSIDTGI